MATKVPLWSCPAKIDAFPPPPRIEHGVAVAEGLADPLDKVASRHGVRPARAALRAAALLWPAAQDAREHQLTIGWATRCARLPSWRGWKRSRGTLPARS